MAPIVHWHHFGTICLGYAEEDPVLRSLKDLEHYKVYATDGDVGSVANFLFDDEHWTIRYLVVKTGSFLNERRVLISPISFREIDWAAGRFHVALTIDKVKNSPDVDVDRPVSRRHERDYYGYYGWPYYWGAWINPTAADYEAPGDGHLRSAQEVRGYHIQGSDDSIGHVDDFIVDDETWRIHYLVVDTGNWWLGKKVLVAPQWAKSVSWEERNVHVSLSRQAIKDCPEWDPYAAVNRQYEIRLYDYYGRPAYWESGVGPEMAPPVGPRHGS